MSRIFGLRRPNPFYESNPPSGGEQTPPAPKMVPESDLLAVKASLERVKAELQGKLDDLTRANAELRTQNQQLNSDLETARAASGEVEQLRSQAAAAEESRKGLETRLLEQVRGTLTQRGIHEDKLKDKTLEQLELIASTLDGVDLGGSNGGRQFDRGGAGGGGTVPATGRGKILAGIEAGELHRVRGGSNQP